MGSYTGADVFLDGHLSINAVRSKLTPRLAVMTSGIEDEIKFVVKKHLGNIGSRNISDLPL